MLFHCLFCNIKKFCIASIVSTKTAYRFKILAYIDGSNEGGRITPCHDETNRSWYFRSKRRDLWGTNSRPAQGERVRNPSHHIRGGQEKHRDRDRLHAQPGGGHGRLCLRQQGCWGGPGKRLLLNRRNGGRSVYH